ncbi:MAG TPA: ABC transporter permease [Candidatus Binatia bacterium]|nr:ABC transporter permease [Candidatus Binatia bacterium]
MRLLARRIGFYLLAAWAGLTFAFIIPRAVPGDPAAGEIAQASAGGQCNSTCAIAIEKQFGEALGHTRTSPPPTRTTFSLNTEEGTLFTSGGAVLNGQGVTIKSIKGDQITLASALSRPPVYNEILKQSLGNPIVQYFQFWGNLFHGDLGRSWSTNEPVATLVLSFLPWTLGLLIVATILSFVMGTAIGVVLAWWRGSALDWVLPTATFFQAIPFFFLAMVLLLVFGQTGKMLHWLPSNGGYDYANASIVQGMNWPYIWSIITHAILPAITVVLATSAGFIMGMRNQMVTTMDEDFVLVARAKGLSPRRVVWYAARNAMLPSISNFAISLSLVVAGQFLVEVIFQYPGIGYNLIAAIQKLDYSLVQGIFVIIILVVLLANFLADIVYVLIDPRARQEA